MTLRCKSLFTHHLWESVPSFHLSTALGLYYSLWVNQKKDPFGWIQPHAKAKPDPDEWTVS